MPTLICIHLSVPESINELSRPPPFFCPINQRTFVHLVNRPIPIGREDGKDLRQAVRQGPGGPHRLREVHVHGAPRRRALAVGQLQRGVATLEHVGGPAVGPALKSDLLKNQRQHLRFGSGVEKAHEAMELSRYSHRIHDIHEMRHGLHLKVLSCRASYEE